MEWERAKSIILVAFVILNLSLAGLLFLEDRRFTLSGDRGRNIQTVLSRHNIVLYTTLPRRFAPMRHLEVSGFYYDINELLPIFLPGDYVELESGEGVYVFVGSGGRLEISNGFIFFDNQRDLSENDVALSREDALAISDAFVAEHFPDFRRDIVFDALDGDGVHIVYLQEYRGRLIESNFIGFLFTGGGLEWIEMQFGRVVGHSAEARMIFAPDEILLTFMQRMHYEAAGSPIIISNIDMVYMQEYGSDQVGAVYPAVPFYRIFTRDRDQPLLINAYTNVIFE